MALDSIACNEWLARHEGVITVGQMKRFGASSSTVYELVGRGDLRLIQPGVLVSAAWPLGRTQQLIGVCMRQPDANIAFTTAGQEWSMRGMADPLIHVMIPHGSTTALSGVVVHRTRRLDPIDIVERPNGLRLTSPARTIFDTADMLGISGTESVIDQVLDRGWMSVQVLIDTVDRLGHPRRPGASTIRSVLWTRPAWRKAVQSSLEHEFRSELRRRGIPEPVVQHRLVLPDGRSVRFDFAWPDWKVAAEMDHYHWHGGRQRSNADRERDRKVNALGWVVVRITDDDLTERLEVVVDDLEAVLAHASGGRTAS